MLLLGEGIQIVALLAITALFGCSYGSVVDCSPKDSDGGPSLVKCEYNKQSDCQQGYGKTTDLLLLPPVKELQVDKFMNKDKYTGINVSWKPDAPLTLNKTIGYIITIYGHSASGSKEQVRCIYMKVWSERDAVWSWEANLPFVYQVQSLGANYVDSNMSVDVLTLPYKPDSQSSSTSTTTFTTYKSTSYKFQYLPRVNNSVPYTLVTSFRLTSYPPDMDILYNHTYYRLILRYKNSSTARNMHGDYVQSKYVHRSTTQEYGEVEYTDLKPGPYNVQIRPYKKGTNCVSCSNTSDASQYANWSVDVKGYDYSPEELPEVYVTDELGVGVIFSVAPKYLHINGYDIILRKPDGSALDDKGTTPEAKADWYRYNNVTFSEARINDNFKVGDLIVAQVIPIVSGKICPTAGDCNLNGTCTPCIGSRSEPLTLAKGTTTPAITPDATAAISQTTQGLPITTIPIVVSVVVVILIVIAVVIVYLRCREKAPPQTENEIPPEPDRNSLHPTYFGDIESVWGGLIGNHKTVYIAYAAGKESQKYYTRLYETLKDLLEKYFNCQLLQYDDLYHRDPAEHQRYDYVTILCTPELHTFQKHMKEDGYPSLMPEDKMQYCRVGDLLRGGGSNPHTAMVTFDHISENDVNELASTCNSRIKVFRLPNNFESLVRDMYTHGDVMAKDAPFPAWKNYLDHGSAYRERLEDDIQSLSNFYKENGELPRDSGCDTMTVDTALQFQRMQSEENSQQQAERTVTPNTRPLYDPPMVGYGERKDTIKPLAEEMKYLRQDSVERPSIHYHSVPTVPSDGRSTCTVTTEQQTSDEYMLSSYASTNPSQLISRGVGGGNSLPSQYNNVSNGTSRVKLIVDT